MKAIEVSMLVVLWDEVRGCWLLRGGNGDEPTGETDRWCDPFMLATAAKNASQVDLVQVWSPTMCLSYRSDDHYQWLRGDAHQLIEGQTRLPWGFA